ncbi:MAG: hypothetical protein SF052_12150 [Bacteroidia bacterium]|nr:hypothetical protein [Bacteroidia bacterium]
MKKIIKILLLGVLTPSCTDNSLENKGFQVNEITETEEGEKIVGIPIDSLELETRPRNVLLTKHPNHRLSSIYKINYDKRTGKPFTGANTYHTNWGESENDESNWNNNFMPGFEAVYGYNFVNISHYNNETQTQKEFFDKPVLVKTLYYPAFSKDTLNNQPVTRDYYMVSVYDEDTNKDGFITITDLRRFYHFDLNGNRKKALIPPHYSAMSSEYDSDNDFMYIFAKPDQNNNGQIEQEEPIHIFWIDLKNPENTGVQYATK